MEDEKLKFKRATIAAWKLGESIQKFIGLVAHPTQEGEQAWRSQYANAGYPFGDSQNGFEEFVRTMPS
jgi:hypothetical protein